MQHLRFMMRLDCRPLLERHIQWLRPLGGRNKSDSPRLYELERRVGKYADRLTPELRGEQQQDNLAQKLRDLLDCQIEKQSSDPTLHNHFTELFTGLDTVTDSPTPLRLKDGLSPDKTEAEILAWFDKFYYQGNISYKVALAVLKDPRVKNIDRLVHQINTGGILIRWAGVDKHFFQLHVANKYWRLGERSQAKHYVGANFDSVWLPELVKDQLPPTRLNILLRAVVATIPERAPDAAEALAAHDCKCALYLLWANAVQFKQWAIADTVIDKAHSDSLFQALALVTDYAREHGVVGLSSLLRLVPGRKDFSHQLSSALMEVATALPDLRRPLADKLDSVEADEATEARIAAFKLLLV